MSNKYTSTLNSEQLKAVEHTRGPAIILAGAGSGKTRVLTYKTMYLLDTKTAHPSEVLMVTFTNKAAQEMRERILAELSASLHPEGITARTFHSFCAYTLRRYGFLDGRDQSFTILDTDDAQSLAKRIIADYPSHIKVTPTSLLHAISDAKNHLFSPHDMQERATDFYDERIADLYKKYQERLIAQNCADFDDLITGTVSLLSQPSILSKIHDTYHYILVDEYQDTNHAQYTIAQKLAQRENNITVVGDFSQSIYSWRGADFTNLEKFQRDYPTAYTVMLEQNYRSTQSILSAAYNVIKHNTSHPILKLWTASEKDEDIVVQEARDGEEEAVYVISTIRTLIEEEGVDPLSIAILYRINAQSRIFEEMCLRAGIRYHIYGGVRFYERKEVKDLLAMVRVVCNPRDDISRERIEKLGKKRSKFIFNALKTVTQQTPGETLQEIMKKTNYASVYDPDEPDDAMRLENITELVSVAHTFTTLSDFLDSVALIESGYERQKTEKSISMMTIHASKGLEFDAVFVVGLEDGVLPHSRSMVAKEHLEEERRLLYVAITRARRYLYLTYAKKRTVYGRTQYNLPSPFLAQAALVEDGVFF